MQNLWWDKNVNKRRDFKTAKNRHPLSMLAFPASSTLVFLVNTSKLLVPNHIISLVPRTPACCQLSLKTAGEGKYAATPERGKLLGEFGIWAPYIL